MAVIGRNSRSIGEVGIHRVEKIYYNFTTPSAYIKIIRKIILKETQKISPLIPQSTVPDGFNSYATVIAAKR